MDFSSWAHLGAREYWRLTTGDHELGAAYGGGGCGDQYAAGDQVIEQLTDGSQMLLDARLGNFGAQLLDVSCYGYGFDVLQPQVVVIAPIEESFYRARIRHPGIAVAGWSR